MDLSNLRVHCVDDTETSRKLLAAALNTLGIQNIILSSSMNAAWQDLIIHKPDIIITDHYLGDGTGLELAKKVRTAPPDGLVSSLPIILMTSRPTREIVEQSRIVQISAMMAKPFSPSVLAQRIQTALQRSNAIQESA
jgi:CheY-like chemotaxis protein